MPRLWILESAIEVHSRMGAFGTPLSNSRVKRFKCLKAPLKVIIDAWVKPSKVKKFRAKAKNSDFPLT